MADARMEFIDGVVALVRFRRDTEQPGTAVSHRIDGTLLAAVEHLAGRALQLDATHQQEIEHFLNEKVSRL